MLFLFIVLLLSDFCLGLNVSSDIRPEIIQKSLIQETIINNLINPIMNVQSNSDVLKDIVDTRLMLDSDVTFVLYTRNDTSNRGLLLKANSANIKSSYFNANRPTKIIVHGWTDAYNTFWIQQMRKNYLQVGDYNVVCLNWFPDSTKEYLIAAKLTRQIGELLAQFLELLQKEVDLSLNDVHILGHSLGAHIAGFAGKKLLGKVGRITGMDPARPSFENRVIHDSHDHLFRNDATFVDIIHSCAGTVGFINPIGHIDFYPNGGTATQPGCPIILSQTCSHGRSYQFMIESILTQSSFNAVKCNNWTDFKLGKCKKNRPVVLMGEGVDRMARGVYYLETNSAPPFGKGIKEN